MTARMRPSRLPGTILSVLPSKGGIGATSVTANLGVALALRGLKTVVVDMTFQLGDLGLMFNQTHQDDLMSARRNGSLDKNALRSILCTHETGVNIVTVATSSESARKVTDEHAIELCKVLRTMFDFVIFDLGRSIDDRSIEVLKHSDVVALMTALDVPAIRNTRKYVEILEANGIDSERARLFLNRSTTDGRLTPADLENALGRELFWTIPNDFGTMSLGIDAGMPAIAEAPRSALAHNFNELAEVLHRTLAVSSAPSRSAAS